MKRTMIRELQIGATLITPLVVMSATARETKAKKPYLQLELYDGVDIIQGNYWDWLTGNIPAKNSILDVTAQVTEYAGTKQLNIKSLKTNADLHISEFEPKSGYNMDEVYKEAYVYTLEVKDDFLRELTINILEQLMQAWLTVPGAKGVHHAFVGGTLVHSLSVAKIALAISKQIPDSNNDLCFVGGMLHDLGKLYTYKLDGIAINMTDEGMLYEHTFMGAEFIGNFVENMTLHAEDPYVSLKLEVLRHIILSHHGLLEYGAAVPPMCIEAHIVHHADGIDATTQQVIEQSRKLGNVKWTDRIYTLANRPQLTTQYMQEIFTALPAEVESDSSVS